MVLVTWVLGILSPLPIIAAGFDLYWRFHVPFPWSYWEGTWISLVSLGLLLWLTSVYWIPVSKAEGKERRRRELESQFKHYFGFVPDTEDTKLREVQQGAVNNLLVSFATRLSEVDKRQREINEKKPETPRSESITDFLVMMKREKDEAKQTFEEAWGNFWRPHDCAEKMGLTVLPRYKMYLDPHVVAQTLSS